MEEDISPAAASTEAAVDSVSSDSNSECSDLNKAGKEEQLVAGNDDHCVDLDNVRRQTEECHLEDEDAVTEEKRESAENETLVVEKELISPESPHHSSISGNDSLSDEEDEKTVVAEKQSASEDPRDTGVCPSKDQSHRTDSREVYRGPQDVAVVVSLRIDQPPQKNAARRVNIDDSAERPGPSDIMRNVKRTENSSEEEESDDSISSDDDISDFDISDIADDDEKDDAAGDDSQESGRHLDSKDSLLLHQNDDKSEQVCVDGGNDNENVDRDNKDSVSEGQCDKKEISDSVDIIDLGKDIDDHKDNIQDAPDDDDNKDSTDKCDNKETLEDDEKCDMSKESTDKKKEEVDIAALTALPITDTSIGASVTADVAVATLSPGEIGSNKPMHHLEVHSEEAAELDYDEDVAEDHQPEPAQEPHKMEEEHVMRVDKDTPDEKKREKEGDKNVEECKKEDGKEDGEDDDDEDDGEVKDDDEDEEDNGEIEDEDDLEEGELKDPVGRRPQVRPICRFFNKGHCTWGASCRFIHPGINDKGNYSLIPDKNKRQMNQGSFGGNGPWGFGQGPDEEPFILPPPPPEEPVVESAWERGLRHAKELKNKAKKKKVPTATLR